MSSDESESSESSLEDGSDESSFLCLRRFFFFLIFFLLRSESDDDDESDESDGGGSGSEFTFGPFFAHFDVEIVSDQIISIRVGLSSIFLLSSIFIFCLSIRVISSRVSISLIFSRSLCSRCNIFIVSKSNSLRYLLNANFPLIFLISS